LWGNVSADRAESIAAQIFQKVPGTNRCVVDLSEQGITQARPLAATVTRERLDLLRDVDAIVMNALQHHRLYRDIWQCPTVFVPLEINGRGREFVVIRPVLSERAMTARPALLPREVLTEIRDQILQLPNISGVAVDVTTKPPGTIEWE
jgi:GMP synthase PP-ATPase subunit